MIVALTPASREAVSIPVSHAQPIQTHYIDWERIWTEAGAIRIGNMFTGGDGKPMPWYPIDSGDEWVASCARYWRANYYQPGPVETAYHLPDDEAEALALCEMLWHKYNADDRPDGKVRRSMSVGDVVQLGEALYLARGRGWAAFLPTETTP